MVCRWGEIGEMERDVDIGEIDMLDIDTSVEFYFIIGNHI